MPHPTYTPQQRANILAKLDANGLFIMPNSFIEAMRTDTRNKDFALAIVKHSGKNLSYLSKKFKKDKKIVLVALAYRDAEGFKYADASLKDDFSFMQEAVCVNPKALQYASDHIKKNRVVVIETVSRDGLMLKHADFSFRKDPGVVLEAIGNNGRALLFASEDFKRDRDFVKIAIENNPDSICLSEYFRGDVEFANLLLPTSGRLLAYFTHFKDNKELVLKAIKSDPHAYFDCSLSLQKDIEVLATAFAFANEAQCLSLYDKLEPYSEKIILDARKKYNCSSFALTGESLLLSLNVNQKKDYQRAKI